jgi:LacI family transcriptional regulator, repressor for deo operon, udp, cdd, tsx, nupC, and nupG
MKGKKLDRRQFVLEDRLIVRDSCGGKGMEK